MQVLVQQQFFVVPKVIIGDYVKIGGNTVIQDTDFHSLDKEIRKEKVFDIPNYKNDEIGNHVFIGAHTTILKGVVIGDNSV